jgi:fibronectin type 3 domain-containing protein
LTYKYIKHIILKINKSLLILIRNTVIIYQREAVMKKLFCKASWGVGFLSLFTLFSNQTLYGDKEYTASGSGYYINIIEFLPTSRVLASCSLSCGSKTVLGVPYGADSYTASLTSFRLRNYATSIQYNTSITASGSYQLYNGVPAFVGTISGYSYNKLTNYKSSNSKNFVAYISKVAIPGGVYASDGTYSDGVHVSWNAVSGATHYKIYRSTSSSGTKISSDWVSGTSIIDQSATPGVTYYYWIEAALLSSGYGASGLGSYNTGSRLAGALTAPTGLAASDGKYTDGVHLSWNAVSGATHYKIYRSTSSSGTKVSSIWFAGTSLTDTTAASGVTYYYWITAARSSSGSGASGFSTYNTGYKFTSALSAPTNLSASDGTYSDGVHLSWNAVNGATHYKVYRSTSSSGTKVSSDWSTSTALTDTTATPGVIYYYWVAAARSSSGSNSSGLSAYNTGSILTGDLTAPTGLSASDGTYTDGVHLRWNAVSGATHYKIYRSTSSTGTKVFSAWFTGTSLTDNTTTTGVTYYYWVTAARSSSGNGESDYSIYNTGVVSAGKLTIPSYISIDKNNTDGVHLTWNAVSGATHYKIYRAEGWYDQKVSTTWLSDRSFVDTSAKPGQVYLYWVTAARSDSGLNESDLGSTAHIGYYSSIYFSASSGTYSDGVHIDWDAVSEATHYKIYRSSTYNGLKESTGWFTGNSFVDTSASPGVYYYYWLKSATSSTGENASDFFTCDLGRRANVSSTSNSSTNQYNAIEPEVIDDEYLEWYNMIP